MYIARRWFGFVFLSAVSPAAPLWPQTTSVLEAPRVTEQIQVRVHDKSLRYALDGRDAYFGLDADHLFLSSVPVKITYPRLNPLRVQINAQLSEAADPGHALVGSLVEALTGIPGVLRPETAKMSAAAFPEGARSADEDCREEVARATEYYTDLNDALYSAFTTPVTIGNRINGWIAAIDGSFDAGHSGGAAVRDGIAEITKYRLGADGEEGLAQKLTSAGKALEAVNKGAQGPAGQCPEATRVYEALRLSNADARFQDLKRLDKVLADLVKTLQQDYVPETRWLNRTFYIVHDQVNPKADKIQKVAVKASAVSITVDDGSNLSVKKEEAASASLTLRHFTRFVPEAGAGATFAFVERTKYGTSTNAQGQTVVGVAGQDDVAVDPSVMLNFVCRCDLGPFVQPMFQVGATASKDTPGILIGVGVRLFAVGKSDVSVSGGGVVAWVKTLKTLKEGDVITGTKEIEADMGFKGTPQLRPYVSLLVKF